MSGSGNEISGNGGISHKDLPFHVASFIKEKQEYLTKVTSKKSIKEGKKVGWDDFRLYPPHVTLSDHENLDL